LVQSRFKDQVTGQVKGSLLMDSLQQVSEEQQFAAISEPDFDMDAVTMPEDGPLTFEFDIEVRPDFDMPEWKGLHLQRPTKEYTDEEVEQRLQAILLRYGKPAPRDGGVEPGDSLDVDIQVTEEGHHVSSLEGVRVTAAPALSLRDATIEGFGELIAGANRGETRSCKVKISDGAENEAMRGKELDVAFTVRDIRYIKAPQLTPDFLEELGGFEDEDELRDTVRGELERQLRYHRQQQLREQITATLTRNANWELPPELVRRQARRELERTKMELRSSGFSEDVIQAHANQIRQNSLRATETALKEHFIFERIAEQQELDVEEDDYELEIRLLADQSGESPRRVRARLEKRGQMDVLRNQIIERKVVDLICSHADFEDVPLAEPADDVCAVDEALASAHDTSDIPEAKHGGEAEDLRQPVDHS
jgi:trigger factor